MFGGPHILLDKFTAEHAPVMVPIRVLNASQFLGWQFGQNAADDLLKRFRAGQVAAWLPVFDLFRSHRDSGNKVTDHSQRNTGITRLRGAALACLAEVFLTVSNVTGLSSSFIPERRLFLIQIELVAFADPIGFL